MRRAVLVGALALLLVTAGCSTLTDPGSTTDAPSPDDTSPAPSTEQQDATETGPRYPSASPDGPGELGVENGVNATDSLAIDASDGIDESELEALTSRTMARVEVIRGLEFLFDVDVRVVNRSEATRMLSTPVSSQYRTGRNVLAEATFRVGEDADATAVRSNVTGTAVTGFYDTQSGALVLVSSGDEGVRIDERTLAHELVHALQDQYGFVDNDSVQQPYTYDRVRAQRALVEGDAQYTQELYADRCGEVWDCVDATSGADAGRVSNGAVYASILFPYVEGSAFVAHVRETHGWDAVNGLFWQPPNSTEQVIHPGDYGRDAPDVDRGLVPEAAGNARINRLTAPMVAGEASMATMFATPEIAGGDTITEERFVQQSGPRYDYGLNASTGWEGDALTGYRVNGDPAYVWISEWETAADAREFATTYRELLRAHGARGTDSDVWRIPDDRPFGDAFSVSRNGTRVVVVNAAGVDEVGILRGELDE